MIYSCETTKMLSLDRFLETSLVLPCSMLQLYLLNVDKFMVCWCVSYPTLHRFSIFIKGGNRELFFFNNLEPKSLLHYLRLNSNFLTRLGQKIGGSWGEYQKVDTLCVCGTALQERLGYRPDSNAETNLTVICRSTRSSCRVPVNAWYWDAQSTSNSYLPLIPTATQWNGRQRKSTKCPLKILVKVNFWRI